MKKVSILILSIILFIGLAAFAIAENDSENCAVAGESLVINPSVENRNCCIGLEGLDNSYASVKDNLEMDCSHPAIGAGIVCSDCGNGNCEDWENKCNCPEDCNSTLVCTQEAKLCSDGSYVSRNSNNGCKFAECPEYNDTIVGASCGTVTPGYNNECCVNKGYDRWDAEEFACIKDNETDNDEEHECDSWNCAKWGACINGTQTRKCAKVFNCTENVKEIPKTNKSCFEKERIRNQYNHSFECPENCTCTGSTIKCEFGDGRTMTVYAGNSGNVIVQIKGINGSTNVTLYKEGGKVYGVFRNNETKQIILPDEVMDKLKKDKHNKNLSLENGSINLTDDGYYLVQTKKHSRLFWLVPVREHMNAEVNAETGEIIKIRNPWWGFLARDIREKEQ